MSQGTLKVVSDKTNAVIPRRELVVEVEHWGQGTPTRHYIADLLRNTLGLPSTNVVVVRKMVTSYGSCVTRAYVHIYNSEDRARAFEPRYILKRNGLLKEDQPQPKQG